MSGRSAGLRRKLGRLWSDMGASVRSGLEIPHSQLLMPCAPDSNAKWQGCGVGVWGERREMRHLGTSERPGEQEKFARLAGEWWDRRGPFRALHSMNAARCVFIRNAACDTWDLDDMAKEPLGGLRVLDVGCGGGLLAEPMARMGAEVTAIDMTEEGLEVARRHAELDPVVMERVEYRQGTAEALAGEKPREYDVVVASEVIEHVEGPSDFMGSLARLVKDDGAVILSTLNRTPRSYAGAIVAAEYVLGLAPKGTHDWRSFLRPEEVVHMAESAGLELAMASGMTFDPIANRWRLGDDMSINYIMSLHKTPT